MASGQIATALTTAGVSIVLGWLGWGADGLLSGYFAGQVVTFLVYARLYRGIASAAPATSPAASLAQLRRHRAYALYTMPTSFIEQLSANAAVYALGLAGAPQTIGLLSRARLLLAMPLNLIGNAVAQVFQQRAAADVARQGHCRKIFSQTFLLLAGLGILPIIVLAVAAPALFELYLGPKWREAGEIARILAPMLLLQLVCSPLATVFYIRRRQQLDFRLSLLTALLIALSAALAALLRFSPIVIVFITTSAMAARYVLYLAISWQLSREQGSVRLWDRKEVRQPVLRLAEEK
jgi:O-antigen/teichoic acid export membrane protein